MQFVPSQENIRNFTKVVTKYNTLEEVNVTRYNSEKYCFDRDSLNDLLTMALRIFETSNINPRQLSNISSLFIP